MQPISQPIEQTPLADAGYTFRPTDKFYLLLTDANGELIGRTVLADFSTLGKMLVRPDQYGVTAPNKIVNPGVEGQKYWHARTATLLDLYQYEAGDWVLKEKGIVLNADATGSGQKGPVVALAPVGTGTVGVQMQLSATATSDNSTIVKVEFFVGTQFIEEDDSAPYGANYTPTGVGTVYITAKATDANNVATVSKAQAVVINAKGTATNLAPIVTVDATPKSVVLGNKVTITATATDPDGSVASVDYYDGATRLGGSISAPYVYEFVPTTVGTHTLTALATDNLGKSTTKLVTITVTAAPVVTVTPDAPTQTSDDTNNVQDFDTPLGKSELLVKIGTAAFAAYAGPYSVGNVSRDEGYYQSKVKAATGRAESTITRSPAFTTAVVTLPTPPAPSFLSYDTTARTATVAPPTGYTIADLRYVLNGAAPATVPTNGMIAVGNAAVNAGALSVYVVANSNRNKGDVAVNEIAYPVVVVNPSFNTQYVYNPNRTAISTAEWGSLPGWSLWLNLPLSTNLDPNFATMLVFDLGGRQIGQFDYNGADSLTPSTAASFAIADSNAAGSYQMNGVTYPGAIYYNGTMLDGSDTRTGSLKLTNGNASISA